MLRVTRTWQSPLADIEFRVASHGQTEPATIHGMGGVTVSGESQRGNGNAAPFRLAADEVTGEFGDSAALTAMSGVGHTSLEQIGASGVRQTTAGDRLEAHFAAVSAKPAVKAGAIGGSFSGATQIESAVIEGHVVLVQYPANSAPQSQTKPAAQSANPLRATAGRAVYEGLGEWLHLTSTPRVTDGGLQLTADKVDVSQASGEAFAHGNVKATWLNAAQGQHNRPGSGDLDEDNPAHAISAEAQLRQSTGEVTFQGQARLWQQSNSIAAPVIVLDRTRQTLTAHSTDAAEPVRAVLLNAGGSAQGADKSKNAGVTGKAAGNDLPGKSTAPTMIRLRGGDLWYSDAERKAVMRGGALGTVVAETGTATTVSNEVELLLSPRNNSASKDPSTALAGAQVERVTAKGNVTVSSEDRRGTGEQLVYTGQTEEYVLTGTVAAPPKMTDPARGTVTGEALIFHSRDESVSVEGGQRRTSTDTRTPK
jgi:lipopolysaccharide export system protein LptA